MHRLLVFGGLSLHGPYGPVRGRASQRHRLALLALLAAEHPRPLTRDELVAYLWPESDTARGRHLLRQALYQLRGTLGDDALPSNSEDVRLDPEHLQCDLWEFRAALERGDLEAAAATYAAPFLTGVYLRGAEEFERWAEAERGRLALRYAEALELLAAEREAAGDTAGAAVWCRRLALHDPYSARSALRLMRALEAAGDRSGALRHAGVHAALLQAELGADPDPEVAALAKRLREAPSPPAGRGATDDVENATLAVGEATGTATTAAEPATLEPAPAGIADAAGRSGWHGLQEHLVVPSRARPLVLASVLIAGLLGALLPEQRGQRALALLGIGDGASLLDRGVLTERERILLADFASPTGDTVLARVATVAFRIDVAQSPVLTLVEPREVRAALGRMERGDAAILDAELAREVALREGIKAVLAGEIARTGAGYLLSAQLIVAGSGEILAAHRETARDSTALLPALDRLSKQLRRRIGESLRSLEANPPLVQVTTSSLEALNKYAQALRIDGRDGTDGRVAALFEEAIALDTTFAMAQARLAVIYQGLFGRSAPQAEMISRAYRHRERLPDRERYILEAFYHNWHTWEPEKAIAALRTLLETDPHHASALHNLAVSYMALGDYARAEEYAHRVLAADSSYSITLLVLGDWQFNQGRIEEAQATHRHLAARFPRYHWVRHRAVLVAAAQGEYAAAEQRAHEERTARREDLDWQLRMVELLADLAVLRGRLAEAERYTLEIGELAGRRERPTRRLFEVLNLAHHELTLGRSAAQALARVERELERTPLAGLDVYDRPYPDLATLHARAGQPQRARALIAEWEALTPTELRRRAVQRARPYVGLVLPWVLGEIALAEGSPLEAARQFHRSNQSSCLICTLPHAGRAYEAAGQPDSAIAAYERFLLTPFLLRLHYDAEWRALVLERLGQLHEARGDHAPAAEYYAQFVELWQDADAELQPRVRAARRRLAALQPLPSAGQP